MKSLPNATRKNLAMKLLVAVVSTIVVLALYVSGPSLASSNAVADNIRSSFAQSSNGTRATEQASNPDSSQLNRTPAVAYGHLPLSFEANIGQTDRRVKFIARGNGYGLFLTETGAVLNLTSHVKQSHQEANAGSDRANLAMRLGGANTNARVTGIEELLGKVNYFIGADPKLWRTNISTFAKVRYQDVYPGVDLVYYGNQRQLEYDFIVAPRADLKRIRLTFRGADGLNLNSDGDLTITTKNGAVSLLKPIAYQEIAGEKRVYPSNYVLTAKDEVSFDVSRYDRSLPLVIDPVLVYSSYLGGPSNDQGLAIAVDATGNAYITGQTSSIEFPVTGSIQTMKRGSSDAFVTKLNPSGTAMIYSTFLGGNGTDTGNAIAIDSSGNAYVTGQTGGSFPLVNPLQSTFAGSFDAFVAQLNSTGSALNYSTYLGGRSLDAGNAIAVDGSGNAYVAGQADSRDFPITNPIQANKVGNAVFRSTNGASLWSASDSGLLASSVADLTFAPNDSSTLYAAGENGIFKSSNGGNSWTQIGAGQTATPVIKIVVDPANPLVIYAATNGGVYKSSNGGSNFTRVLNQSFIRTLVIDPLTPATLYATAIGNVVFKSTDGGTNWSSGSIGVNLINSLAIDPTTPSTLYAGTNRGVFKTTNGAGTWSPANASIDISIRVVVLDRTNTSIVYAGANSALFKSTNGGASWNNVNGNLPFVSVSALAIDPVNSSTIYMGSFSSIYKTTDGGNNWTLQNTGYANTQVNSLVIDGSNVSTLLIGTLSGSEAFVTKLIAGGTAASYSTYLGGVGNDVASAIAVDSDGNAYLTGFTSSPDFPVANPVQPAKAPGNDAFVVKVNSSGLALVYSTYLGGDQNDSGRGIALDGARNAYVTGTTNSTNFPVVSALQSTPGDSFLNDAFITKLDPAGSALVYSTYLGGSADDQGYAIAVDSFGNASLTGTTSSANFPVRGAFQPSRDSNSPDAFVSTLSNTGAALISSSYLGGNGADVGRGLALDPSGNAYIVGITASSNFPTVNPLQAAYHGSSDLFITKISQSPDLSITMTDSPDPVLYGHNLTYTAVVTNNGELPAHNVTLADTLHSGTGTISITPNVGTCSGNRFINCTLGTINPGSSVTITIVVVPPLVRTITNTATVSTTDSEPTANNTASQSTLVDYTDLKLKNSSALQLTGVGEINTYITTVTNNGPVTAFAVNLVNNLPPEVTFVSCTSTGSGQCGGAGNNRNVTVPSLAVGESITTTFAVRVNGNISPGTVITDTATVASVTPDINPNNDGQTATTTVRAATAPKQNGLIAFNSGLGTGTSGDNGIYLVNPDGTGFTTISFALQEDVNPIWSPDGTRIAFVSRGTVEGYGIFVMNADGSNRRRLTNSNIDQSPTWSPDGTRIAFGGSGGQGSSYGIHVINVDGSNLMRLRDGNDPVWSPDGVRIAFAHGFDVGMMYADGSPATNLPLPRSLASTPAWSPDGSKLALSLSESGGSFSRSLYTMNADGTGLASIPNTAGGGFPSWSPDGTKITFISSFSTGGLPVGLYTISVDGTGLSNISGDLTDVNYPSWQTRPPNFTPLPPTYNISGRVSPFGSLQLTGTLTSFASTNQNGDYMFRGLRGGGNYTVQPVPNDGYTSSPANRVYNNLTANQTGADFTLTFIPSTISGFVKDINGVPLQGVTVSSRNGFPEGTTLTSQTGFFSFGNSQRGRTYFVSAYSFDQQYANYVFDPIAFNFQLGNSQTLNFTGRQKTASISGRVTVGGVGISGVQVFTTGLQSLSAMTDANGNYTFTGLAEGGSFPVQPNSAVYPFSPAVRTVVANGQTTGVNFDAPANQYVIFGTILDLGGRSIEGVTVTVTGGASATTDNRGEYTIGPLPAGVPYLVSPTKVGYDFVPTVQLPNLTSNTRVNFTGYQNLVFISSSSLNREVTEGVHSVDVTLVRSGYLPNTVRVDFTTSDGTARQLSDYTGLSKTVIFGPQESVKTITIPINDDAYVEGDETFTVSLSNPAGCLLGTEGNALITIHDDDTITTLVNPIDNSQFFVRQHYYDFLSRLPDPGGLGYWTEQITNCGIDALCLHRQRVGVSAAYFIEAEFQRTGYVVYRMHRAALGTWPGGPRRANLAFNTFMADRGQLAEGPDLPQLTVNFANAFVQRSQFLQIYPNSMSNAQFVNKLFDTAALTPYVTERQQQIDAMNNNGKTRAQVLLDVIEIPEFKTREYNPAFVLMQYFGYLRRDPEQGGYDFWLDILNNRDPNNFRGMVCAFLTSAEYQRRFGTAVTRFNSDCAQ